MTEDELRSLFPNASEQFIRANVERGAHMPSAVVPVNPAPMQATKRIRQSAKPVLNKLESRFHQKLIQDFPGQLILPQAIRLELARGIWYKPDFFFPVSTTFYEVKGPHAFRGGMENLKIAARVHSWAKFFLVWEDDSRAWRRQEILT